MCKVAVWVLDYLLPFRCRSWCNNTTSGWPESSKNTLSIKMGYLLNTLYSKAELHIHFIFSLHPSCPLQSLFGRRGPLDAVYLVGKVQDLFAIWYTWQCYDSINISFTAIYSSRGNHHGLWRTIILGWRLLSFPKWVCVCVCLCTRVLVYLDCIGTKAVS